MKYIPSLSIHIGRDTEVRILIHTYKYGSIRE